MTPLTTDIAIVSAKFLSSLAASSKPLRWFSVRVWSRYSLGAYKLKWKLYKLNNARFENTKTNFSSDKINFGINESLITKRDKNYGWKMKTEFIVGLQS